MKRMLTLILAVAMVMAMTVSAFAKGVDTAEPCKKCDGNHVYEEACVQTYYEDGGDNCIKVVVRHYLCCYCKDAYTADPVRTPVPHDYTITDSPGNGSTHTHYHTCTQCGHTYQD